MINYYSSRAKEYEKIYEKDDPIRQNKQEIIKNKLIKYCNNLTVLEVACGTGYWTQFISQSANSIIATDYSIKVLNEAKIKNYNCKINFKLINAFKLNEIKNKFDIAVANFWFSHIIKSKINLFLNILNSLINKNGLIFIADNVYIPGIGGELIKDFNDTYKIRKLEDVKEYKILKNYYKKDQLKNIFKKFGELIEIFYGQCFWFVIYKIKN